MAFNDDLLSLLCGEYYEVSYPLANASVCRACVAAERAKCPAQVLTEEHIMQQTLPLHARWVPLVNAFAQDCLQNPQREMRRRVASERGGERPLI